jgi:ATP adenylyltransferase/5',5'''-P-1,P-4-tetraphosphate phosphorylase II
MNLDYQHKTHDLFHEQKVNWPLLAVNWEGLKQAQIKTFQFDGFSLKVQYNPKRITSSAAKVDKATIEARPCFLCGAHRPSEQNQVAFEPNYEILCNPFPIFHEHYTIAHINHIPQEIKHSFADFLEISKALPDLAVFYNAPNCGASAPDHLHFQAGNKGFLPFEDEFESLKSKYGVELINNPSISLTAINDGLRRIIVLESDDKKKLETVFSTLYQFTSEIAKGDEPMLNILCWYNNEWRIAIFLREKHRPWQYFEAGEKNILLSPASVDFGGTLITPLEKDFEKISKNDVADILNQCSLNLNSFKDLQQHLKTNNKN